MITLAHIYKDFGPHRAVDNVSFKIKDGQKHVLIGTSGSGKTTLLKMINKLVPKSSGTIFVADRDTDEWDGNALRRKLGYVIQDVGLFPHYTIEENIAVLPRMLKWPVSKIADRVRQLTGMVGLPDNLLNRYPASLSGGQQQRVGIARALAADPDILLMDEPFGALDPITRAGLQQEFSQLSGIDNKTVVLVTHDMLEAAILGEMITLMDHGRVMQTGTLSDLLFNPASDFVSGFLASQRDQLELFAVEVSVLSDLLPANTEFHGQQIVAPQCPLKELPAEGAFEFVYKGRKVVTSKSDCLAVFYKNRDLVIKKYAGND